MADIFDEMRRMQEDMDRMFGNLFRSRSRKMLPAGKEETAITSQDVRMPVADVRETENSVITTVELPGVVKEDIELNVTERGIEITAKKRVKREQRGKGVYSYESSSSQFYRKMPLPAVVNPSTTKAEYKNGMLRIEVKKDKTSEKRKKISIR